MSKLPKISGAECVKALAKAGFYLKRRESSYLILRRDNPIGQVVVPAHKELRDGALRKIIRDADLTVDEFINLL